jgi:hypothetical protein
MSLSKIHVTALQQSIIIALEIYQKENLTNCEDQVFSAQTNVISTKTQ